MFSILKRSWPEGSFVQVIAGLLAVSIIFGGLIGGAMYLYYQKGIFDFSSCYQLDNCSATIQVSDQLEGIKIFCQDNDRTAKEVYARLLLAGAEIGTEDNFDYLVSQNRGEVEVELREYRGELSEVQFYSVTTVLTISTEITPFALSGKMVQFIKKI